jgi:hypothetical protein
MNTVLLVPDGVGVRNFVLGTFLSHLGERSDVDVLHAIPSELLPAYAAAAGTTVDWHRLRAHREPALEATLRYSLAYAQMNWVGTRSMRFNASRKIIGSWRTRLMHAGARVAGRAAAFPAGIRALERVHRASASAVAVAPYERLFQRLRTSVLFCTHQRPPVILAPVLAARRLGIPTATFIFSWDNLSSKGRIAAPFDHYLVWSETMGDELRRYYPDVAHHRIHVVGTPQFDPYGDRRLLLTRADFFARIGADPARPLVCYSGGDTGNCPEDHHHVRILMELIRSGRIAGRPQVLLRPSPADEGLRYAPVRQAFPELIYQPPKWVHAEPGSWANVFPHADDPAFLANLTAHADLNVNFGSTMTLDFALHDHPVVTPAFDVTSPPVHGMPLLDFCLQFEHYQPVAALGAARFARSVDEFADHINAYLADPALDREGRRQLVALHVNEPPGRATRRVVEVLATIAARGQSHRRSSRAAGQAAYA